MRFLSRLVDDQHVEEVQEPCAYCGSDVCAQFGRGVVIVCPECGTRTKSKPSYGQAIASWRKIQAAVIGKLMKQAPDCFEGRVL